MSFGQPHATANCQYVYAATLPIAPFAKLKMPYVVYVTTSPVAVSE